MIGSGPNGLVAACVLARAGLEVVVLEGSDRPGGAAWTVESTLPGFRHDVGAAFFPFGQLSPAFKALRMEGAGLSFLHAPIDSAHPARDGSCGVLARDLARSDELLGEDGPALRDWVEWWREVEPRILPVLLSTLPPVREALKIPPLALARFARVGVASGRGFASSVFQTEAARRMFPALALHTDVAPSDPLGAIVGFMLAMTSTTGGFAIPEGGALSITNALLVRLAQARGRVELGARVERIDVEGGKVVGVRARGLGTIEAKVGVVAATAAPTLYLKLLSPSVVPSPVIDKMRAFRRGFGTFKMDWALDGPVPWTSEPCREAAVVHTGEGLDDLDRFAGEVRSGELPRDPYLVIGQQTLVDPSRAPAGKHTLWAYSRVPGELAGGYTDEVKRAFAGRIEARIEGLAPGFKERILGRAIVSPTDLEAMDENLLGGDLGGGTADIKNQLFLRPVFPYYRYRTPVRGLYLGSSYAHPGAGVHGMCGYNAAHALLEDRR